MIPFFILFLAIQNAVASEETTLLQIKSVLETNMNKMAAKIASLETKVEHLEKEIQVRAVLVNGTFNTNTYEFNVHVTKNHSRKDAQK